MTASSEERWRQGSGLREAFEALCDAEVDRHSPSGGWNAWEIAYHLLDMERWHLAKICEAASGSRPAALVRFVHVWGQLREAVAALALSVPGERLDTPGLLSGVPGWTPRALLAVIAAHDREHLAQLRAAARGDEGSPMPHSHILHIADARTWEAAQTAGVYIAESLTSEGFIHCSTPQQTVATAERYFAGRAGLVLLVLDPERLTAALVYEPSTDGELFPHVYGPLTLDAVQAVLPFEPGADGRFSLPPEVANLS